jgi:hypothetical protein
VSEKEYNKLIGELIGDNITTRPRPIGLSSSGGELALVVAKGGTDVGVTSSFLLPMVGAMTIITIFISPCIIKFGWKFAESFINKSKKLNNNNKIKKLPKSLTEEQILPLWLQFSSQSNILPSLSYFCLRHIANPTCPQSSALQVLHLGTPSCVSTIT